MILSLIAKVAVRSAVGTALLLLVPLTAMQYTAEVNWGAEDFGTAAVILFAAGMTYGLAASRPERPHSKVLIAGAALLGLALVWVELAVGILD